MRTKTVKKCPKCGDPLWLTLVGHYWDEYECDNGHKFTTAGIKPAEFKLQEAKIPNLRFRPATWADAGPLYVWRTDPETQRWSFKLPPTWDQHLRWLSEEMTKWPETTFIGVTKMGIPVCMVAIHDDEVSIMVHPLLRRQGYARQAIEWAQDRESQLTAKVLIGNTAGLKLFASCGFEIVGAEVDYVVLRWQKEAE